MPVSLSSLYGLLYGKGNIVCNNPSGKDYRSNQIDKYQKTYKKIQALDLTKC